MPLFPYQSETSHSSQNRESLSEAFLDSSSARDALPEQYRAQFDELRGNILAFCKEFDIPVETLRSKEDFGKQLTSKKISSERMAQAVLFFERLEYLITNKEPFKTESEIFKEVEPLYHLTEQYHSQVSLLERAGILKEGVITGIDGREYPIPTLGQIVQRLFEREQELSTKRDQGFTKLLLVPFGMSLDVLCKIFKQFLLSYKQTHPDFGLDTNKPLWTWEEGYLGADTEDPPKIVYNPKSFGENHQGQTKHQILKEQTDNQDSSPFPGWRIHLFQTPEDNLPGFRGIPRQGQGQTQEKRTLRPSLEAGKSPIEYLSFLQKAKDDPFSPYFQESGLTPEDWILAFITHLEETGQPLDDYGSAKESVTYLAGTFFPSSSTSSDGVPCADWNCFSHQAYLSMNFSGDQDGRFGIRTSVVI